MCCTDIEKQRRLTQRVYNMRCVRYLSPSSTSHQLVLRSLVDGPRAVYMYILDLLLLAQLLPHFVDLLKPNGRPVRRVVHVLVS